MSDRSNRPLRGSSRRSAGLTSALIVALLVGLAGCASKPPVPTGPLLAPTEEQMKLRNMQTRDFDIGDRRVAMRAVIAALQDLGFIIERANEPLGLVTGARFAEPNFFDVVGITVTVRTVEKKRTTIRANAIFNNQPITDPEVYRNFFATLERALLIGRS